MAPPAGFGGALSTKERITKRTNLCFGLQESSVSTPCFGIPWRPGPFGVGTFELSGIPITSPRLIVVSFKGPPASFLHSLLTSIRAIWLWGKQMGGGNLNAPGLLLADVLVKLQLHHASGSGSQRVARCKAHH